MEVHSLTKVKFTDLKCKKKSSCAVGTRVYSQLKKKQKSDGILKRNCAVSNALKCGPDFGRLVFAGLYEIIDRVKIFLLRNILMLH